MKYKSDDLLTTEQAAEVLGYAVTSLQNGQIAQLSRLRIATDESWRKAYSSKAQYVYRYGDLLTWKREH